MLFTLQLSKLTQLGHLTSKGKKKRQAYEGYSESQEISSELFIPSSERERKREKERERERERESEISCVDLYQIQ
jgi:hypothetical protein